MDVKLIYDRHQRLEHNLSQLVSIFMRETGIVVSGLRLIVGTGSEATVRVEADVELARRPTYTPPSERETK